MYFDGEVLILCPPGEHSDPRRKFEPYQDQMILVGPKLYKKSLKLASLFDQVQAITIIFTI